MNSKILALSVALAATTAAASVAEAGGGVRLNFGLPLGNFTATPSHGGGNASQRRAAKRKPAPTYVRRTPSPEPTRVAKPASEPETTNDTTDSAATDSTTDSTGPTGSTALIQTSTSPVSSETGSDADSDTPVTGETAETEPETQAATPDASEPAKDTAAVTDDADETGEVKADETKADDPETKLTDVGCKKFIPAIGLTITVSCKDKE